MNFITFLSSTIIKLPTIYLVGIKPLTFRFYITLKTQRYQVQSPDHLLITFTYCAISTYINLSFSPKRSYFYMTCANLYKNHSKVVVTPYLSYGIFHQFHLNNLKKAVVFKQGKSPIFENFTKSKYYLPDFQWVYNKVSI